MPKLHTRLIEKPWGRDALPAPFHAPASSRIGEIWFEAVGAPPPLLLKYIFTSERLSIQVHPDDELARASGFRHGKDECWYVLAADPGATIGIGTHQALDAAALRAAALSGEIETLMDWRAVRAGDFFHIPPGTVHAIGAGIVLAEIQQNIDLTYRLYDYGRPRELHLDDGVKASHARPYSAAPCNVPLGSTRRLPLAPGAPYMVDLVHWAAGGAPACAGWFLPLSGSGAINGEPWQAGECWVLAPEDTLRCNADTDALIAQLAA